jgi:hypothetical protein
MLTYYTRKKYYDLIYSKIYVSILMLCVQIKII